MITALGAVQVSSFLQSVGMELPAQQPGSQQATGSSAAAGPSSFSIPAPTPTQPLPNPPQLQVWPATSQSSGPVLASVQGLAARQPARQAPLGRQERESTGCCRSCTGSCGGSIEQPTESVLAERVRDAEGSSAGLLRGVQYSHTGPRAAWSMFCVSQSEAGLLATGESPGRPGPSIAEAAAAAAPAAARQRGRGAPRPWAWAAQYAPPPAHPPAVSPKPPALHP